MALTPMDIHNKEFPVRMRGYDQDEVNDYLDQIIKDYEMLLKQKKETEKKLDLAEEKLANYDQMHDSLNKSILVAQEAADRLKLNAEKEAEMIAKEANTEASNLKHDAENNADELLKDAVNKARKIEQETEELRKQSRIFRQRLQLMIESQLELVKKEEWDDILQPPASEQPEIETIKEVKKELDEKDGEETADLKHDSEPSVSVEEEYEEGMTPAVELP
ncbi:cell division initiation protein [Alkalibacterium putridalgicola]|uniref:Cell division initiation protein n=1 Tax=Alkalibacterium putridalgicola TaxID=426703 RepID=A0A1H7VUE6_9LACT|nr:DivIVA domain-containing protein [Alkalibacterium putridalgicola]GEK89879.1 cell division protein DivIVA [Alkalibacterium putridalgicola]SEM12674.1 cell division initiation protein [Alkalibacterium putridalgicola]